MDLQSLEHRIKTVENYIQNHQSAEVQSAKWEGEVAEQLRSINKAITTLTDSVTKLNKGLEELSTKPAKKYDNIISYITSGIIAFIIARITSGV